MLLGKYGGDVGLLTATSEASIKRPSTIEVLLLRQLALSLN